jgi:glucose/arabinose dehydrogenase
MAASRLSSTAASGLDIYSNISGVPGWSDSLLLASLTRGGVYRVALNATHDQVIGTPTLIFKSTNRYRDIAIRPDGKAFYLVTDNVGPTRDDAGVSTRELANPGAILEFTYDP